MIIRPLVITAALLVVSLVIGVVVGPAAYSIQDLQEALFGGQEGPARAILLSIRFPRVVAAALVGASLALSGTIFQAVLRNPLAEPYLLGVQAGAALGAATAITFGLTTVGSLTLPLTALVGALVAIGVVFRVARVSEQLDTHVLLLAGVVSSSFFVAALLLLLTLASTDSLQSAFFWTLGNLGGVSWRMILVLAVWLIPSFVVSVAKARDLNALSLGEETAASLGTEVESVKHLAYFLASLLAAAAVSVAGVIGFIGLVVPHAVRLLWGADHRMLIPTSFLGGAAVLVLADAAGRTVASPLEIPVGVVTAFVGVPFFLALLRRGYAR